MNKEKYKDNFLIWGTMGNSLVSCGMENEEINIIVMTELKQNHMKKKGFYSSINDYGYCDVLVIAQVGYKTKFLKSLEKAGLPTICENNSTK